MAAHTPNVASAVACSVRKFHSNPFSLDDNGDDEGGDEAEEAEKVRVASTDQHPLDTSVTRFSNRNAIECRSRAQHGRQIPGLHVDNNGGEFDGYGGCQADVESGTIYDNECFEDDDSDDNVRRVDKNNDNISLSLSSSSSSLVSTEESAESEFNESESFTDVTPLHSISNSPLPAQSFASAAAAVAAAAATFVPAVTHRVRNSVGYTDDDDEDENGENGWRDGGDVGNQHQRRSCAFGRSRRRPSVIHAGLHGQKLQRDDLKADKINSDDEASSSAESSSESLLSSTESFSVAKDFCSESSLKIMTETYSSLSNSSNEVNVKRRNDSRKGPVRRGTVKRIPIASKKSTDRTAVSDSFTSSPCTSTGLASYTTPDYIEGAARSRKDALDHTDYSCRNSALGNCDDKIIARVINHQSSAGAEVSSINNGDGTRSKALVPADATLPCNLRSAPSALAHEHVHQRCKNQRGGLSAASAQQYHQQTSYATSPEGQQHGERINASGSASDCSGIKAAEPRSSSAAVATITLAPVNSELELGVPPEANNFGSSDVSSRGRRRGGSVSESTTARTVVVDMRHLADGIHRLDLHQAHYIAAATARSRRHRDHERRLQVENEQLLKRIIAQKSRVAELVAAASPPAGRAKHVAPSALNRRRQQKCILAHNLILQKRIETARNSAHVKLSPLAANARAEAAVSATRFDQKPQAEPVRSAFAVTDLRAASPAFEPLATSAGTECAPSTAPPFDAR